MDALAAWANLVRFEHGRAARGTGNMADNLFFRVASISLSRANGHKPVSLEIAARHNLREIQAELGFCGRIDPVRTADNVILAGPQTAAEVLAVADSLLARVKTSHLKRDHCRAIEAVFSLSTSSSIDNETYFTKCLNWLTQITGHPAVSAVIHNDEAAPHMHVLLLPVKDGRHVGGSEIARPKLKRLRDDFFQSVAGPAGLKRDGAKLSGQSKQWGIKAVIDYCEAAGFPALYGVLWPLMVDAIRHNPLSWLLTLGIDPNSIRPTSEQSTVRLLEPPTTSPIGLSMGLKAL